jgi:flagellin-like protein
MSMADHFKSVFSNTQSRGASFLRREQGVTGLETAIILIAFVVVASVFAFTVLSTGTFSAQKGDETVHAGLTQARGGIQLEGSVIANGVVDIELSHTNTTWTALADVTATRDATDKKEGTYSGELTIASSKTGLLAYENISPTIDLSSYDSVRVWLKSDVATTSGQLSLVLDDSEGCSSPLERISLPVLAASTWKSEVVGISASTTRSTVACVGFYLETSLGTQGTLNFDSVVARGQVSSVVLMLANTVEGIAVDLNTPSDSDNDGIADSESRSHNVIVSYSDENQLKDDMYWTKNFIGLNDGDDLLEVGERVEVTVSLRALGQATPLVRDTEFTIEVKPNEGSTLAIQRSTPARIDAVMNLK